jgi:hypothetical protein
MVKQLNFLDDFNGVETQTLKNPMKGSRLNKSFDPEIKKAIR